MTESAGCTRRNFLLTATCSAGLCRGSDPQYEILVKGGRVVDPSTGPTRGADVAIRAGKIARVGSAIPTSHASKVIDASGCIVTPGLVDMHVHVYDGVVPLGIPADANCIAKGVTTVLDGGSAGAHTFPGMRKYVMERAETRVYALLNIAVMGQTTFSTENQYGEGLDLRFVNAALAARTIERNRDRILGIKVRLTRNIAGDTDLELLRRSCEAARWANVPAMVHIGGSHSPLRDILAVLRGGDVITHGLRAGDGGILGAGGAVLPEVRDAIARGIILDVGHGANGFSFETAERALAQGLLPHTISSDLHAYNVNGPVYDLATTLSKFMALGLTLEQTIARATVNPARAFAFPERPGTLAEGRTADVSVLRVAEQQVTFVDSEGVKRQGKCVLEPVATVRGGSLYAPA